MLSRGTRESGQWITSGVAALLPNYRGSGAVRAAILWAFRSRDRCGAGCKKRYYFPTFPSRIKLLNLSSSDGTQ